MQSLEETKLDGTTEKSEYPVPENYTGVKVQVIPEKDHVLLAIAGEVIVLSASAAQDLGKALRTAGLHAEKVSKAAGLYKKGVKRLKNPKRGKQVTKVDEEPVKLTKEAWLEYARKLTGEEKSDEAGGA
jgi:hypothetical protein